MDIEIAKKILEKTKSDYEKIVVGFDATRSNSPHFEADLRHLVEFAEAGEKVLDLGAGNGRLYELLKDKKVDYLGVDNCAPLVDRAKSRFPGANFEIGEATDLSPLGEETFDLVFAVALLHHIPSRELRLQVLKEIKRVLKNDGLLVMSNWNLYQPKYLATIIKYTGLRAARKIILDWGDVLVPWKTKEKVVYRYYHAFTKEEVKGLLEEAGFAVVDIYYLKDGRRTDWMHGANLIVVARK